MKTYPCRCAGKGRREKPNTEAEVRLMVLSGSQDDCEGGVLELRTCLGCGCTFSLRWTGPVIAPLNQESATA